MPFIAGKTRQNDNIKDWSRNFNVSYFHDEIASSSEVC